MWRLQTRRHPCDALERRFPRLPFVPAHGVWITRLLREIGRGGRPGYKYGHVGQLEIVVLHRV